ncbi:alpha/beta fold hydrolase [Marinilongibacter aquaticus]|uniref:alpha/beta fold hydrolase n=1 Tax=Marinilongibacter aquaticus TaxID=2975157 RepID=UPI0021BDD8E8|nr:alpha/beta fold hydrolase [Marinilongibacter aquaticus]UBM60406.1 alpha/beta fold hydrolase [Marinilongibacter aquaticus]
MKLFFRKLGEGRPLVILHGVFGSSDNLFTVSKHLAENGFAVYILDARNHGQSPHSAAFNYDEMAGDLNTFLEDHQLQNPIILGHSMGGKTVMQFAQNYDNFEKLIVVDIAPKYYPPHHQHIIDGLRAIPIDELKSRKEAEEIFGQYVSDLGERQFILKNIYRTEDGGFAWRLNVPVIAENIEEVGAEIVAQRKIEKPVLFIRGGESPYISDADFKQIQDTFTQAKLITIPGANHWVHATQPKAFLETVLDFANE